MFVNHFAHVLSERDESGACYSHYRMSAHLNVGWVVLVSRYQHCNVWLQCLATLACVHCSMQITNMRISTRRDNRRAGWRDVEANRKCENNKFAQAICASDAVLMRNGNAKEQQPLDTQLNKLFGSIQLPRHLFHGKRRRMHQDERAIQMMARMKCRDFIIGVDEKITAFSNRFPCTRAYYG